MANLPQNEDAQDPTISAAAAAALLPNPIINNNGGGGGGINDSRACAACKYQRRRCAANCPLAPYFPPTEPEKFANIHKVYGLRNIMRVYKEVPPQQRDAAMQSMIWEAAARAHDPIGGCYRIVQRLESEIQRHKVEWDVVQDQLTYLKNYYAAAATAAEAPGGGASGSKEPMNDVAPAPAPAPGPYFPPTPPAVPQSFGGFYPDLGLGFPPAEPYLPPVSGYQDALAVISNKNLTPGASSSAPPQPFFAAAGDYEVPPGPAETGQDLNSNETLAPGGSSSVPPQPFFPAAGGYEEAAAVGVVSEKGQTLISSGSDLSESFFPVGGYQEALKQAMGYSSVGAFLDHDVGLLSKKLKSTEGMAMPVSGYEQEDHGDVRFIPKDMIKQESPRVNDGEKNDESLKSQARDGGGDGF